MDPVTMGLMGIQAVGAIQGLLGSRRALAAARRAREIAKQNLGAAYDKRYQNMAAQGARDIYGAAGVGGDSIRALYNNAMSSSAGAGVYGSTADAGIRQKALDTVGSTIADMSSRNFASLENLMAEKYNKMADLEASGAAQDMAMAQEQYGNSIGSIASMAAALQGMQKPKAVQPVQPGYRELAIGNAANIGSKLAGGFAGIQMPPMAMPISYAVQSQFQPQRDYGRSMGPAMNGMNQGSTSGLWRGIGRAFTLPRRGWL